MEVEATSVGQPWSPGPGKLDLRFAGQLQHAVALAAACVCALWPFGDLLEHSYATFVEIQLQ